MKLKKILIKQEWYYLWADIQWFIFNRQFTDHSKFDMHICQLHFFLKSLKFYQNSDASAFILNKLFYREYAGRKHFF